MNDYVQIRRSIKPSEYLPVFDTAFLLDPHYCFVPDMDFKRPVYSRVTHENFEQYSPKIQEMLDQGIPVRVMIGILGISRSLIYKIIKELG